jgi:hypothetical protein
MPLPGEPLEALQARFIIALETLAQEHGVDIRIVE